MSRIENTESMALRRIRVFDKVGTNSNPRYARILARFQGILGEDWSDKDCQDHYYKTARTISGLLAQSQKKKINLTD